MKKKFLRRNTGDYSRLGKNRKKLQKWRRPKGRDNKMRLKEKGYPRTVEIGYKKGKKIRGKINGKEIIKINNMKELEALNGNNLIVLGKIGKKKKIEIIKKIKEKKLEILKFDMDKYLEKNEKIVRKESGEKNLEKNKDVPKVKTKQDEDLSNEA